MKPIYVIAAAVLMAGCSKTDSAPEKKTSEQVYQELPECRDLHQGMWCAYWGDTAICDVLPGEDLEHLPPCTAEEAERRKRIVKGVSDGK
jgi:hypothetical protein